MSGICNFRTQDRFGPLFLLMDIFRTATFELGIICPSESDECTGNVKTSMSLPADLQPKPHVSNLSDKIFYQVNLSYNINLYKTDLSLFSSFAALINHARTFQCPQPADTVS